VPDCSRRNEGDILVYGMQRAPGPLQVTASSLISVSSRIISGTPFPRGACLGLIE
jgi:hypothetical protein